MCGLKSVTGHNIADVGSLLQPTDLLFLYLEQVYVIFQSQVPTILPVSDRTPPDRIRHGYT